MEGNFDEYGIDLEAARKLHAGREEERKNERPQYNWYGIPPDGSVRGRFLPRHPNSKEAIPGKVVKYHSNFKIPDRQGDLTKIVCFEQYGMTCPLCEIVKEHGHKSDEYIRKPFAVWAKTFFNWITWEESRPVADRTARIGEVSILSVNGENLRDWLLQTILNPDVGDITNPMTGANVTITRKRTNGALDKMIARGASPIVDGGPDEVKRILASMYDLDAIWRTPDDTFVKKMAEVEKFVRNKVENVVLGLRPGSGATRSVPGQNGATAPQHAAPRANAAPAREAAPGKPEPVSASGGATKGGVRVPKGAPTCFGDEAVFNAAAEKCYKCVFCPTCEVSVGNAKAAATAAH